MPYPAYDLGLSAGGFVGPVSEAPPGNRLTLESNLNRSFSSFPAGAEHGAMGVIWLRSNREVMVVGEGLLGALRLALRVVACGNAFSLRSNRTLIEASHPSLQGQNIGQRGLIWLRSNREVMVVGEGLFVASLLTLRAVAVGNVLSLSLEPNLNRRFSLFPDKRKLLHCSSS